MTSADNAFQIIAREVEGMLHPVRLALESPARRRALFDQLGWDADGVSGLPGALANLFDSAQSLVEALETPPETLDEVLAILASTETLFAGIQDLQALMGDDPPTLETLEDLGHDLIDLLLVRHLSREHPLLFEVACLLTIIQVPTGPTTPVVVDGDGFLARHPTARPTLRPERIIDLLTDPEAVFRGAYMDGDAVDTDALLPRVAGIVSALRGTGLPLGKVPFPPGLAPAIQDAADKGIRVRIPFRSEHGTKATVGFDAAYLGPGSDGGLLVQPTADVKTDFEKGGWSIHLELAADGNALVLRRSGASLADGSGSPSARAAVVAERLRQGSLPVLVVGGRNGTRLEVGGFRVKVDAEASTDGVDFGVEASVTQSALVIDPGDGDGFLAAVLPKGLRADFELSIGWSTRSGLRVGGNAGMEVVIPVRKTFLGVLDIESITAGLHVTDDPSIRLDLGVTGSLVLGPVVATVDRVGLAADVRFPPDGGNLGPADLALSFRLPDGIGISVDAAVVKGGGYIHLDPDAGRYAGLLHLDVQDVVAIKAIAILDTRMPDGSEGYSLVAILTGEFPPIQLGYGFTLDGLGGLLGVHRTLNVDALRGGIRAGSLDSILFPPDPVQNAPRIIRDLSTIFPPAQGRHVFGPMAILSWGGALPLISAELGVLVELPPPIRIALLGKLKVNLPHEDAALVKLRCDIAGILDMERREMSIDASLVDSSIVGLPLAGDLAMRLRWGDDAVFVFSAGGLHPRFTAPPGFPTLRRLSVSLSASSAFSLRLESYLAVTSNTAQVGAALDLKAKVSAVSITGHMGFDALFRFDPFLVEADVGANVTVKWKSKTLMGVWLDATLTGPGPWNAKGKAKVKVLFFKVTARFDKRFGPTRERTPVPSVDARQLLRGALLDVSNWSAHLPRGPAVTLRKAEADRTRPLLMPSGTLTIQQRVLPLDLRLDKLGSQRITGRDRFSIEEVQVGGDTAPREAVLDSFAPAQYQELSDGQRLSRPSFERLPAGVRVASDGVAVGAGGRTKEMVYEEKELYTEPLSPLETHVARARLTQVLAVAGSRFGAAARSTLLVQRVLQASTGPVRVVDAAYKVDVLDGPEAPPVTAAGIRPVLSFSQALQAADALGRETVARVVLAAGGLP